MFFAPGGDSQGPPLQNRVPDLGQHRLLRASCTNMGDSPQRRMLNWCEALVGFDVFLSPPSYRAFPFRFWALNIEYCTLIPLLLFDPGIPSSDGVG